MKRAINSINIILIMSFLFLFGNVGAIYAQCTTPPTLQCKTANVTLDASGNASIDKSDVVSNAEDKCCGGDLDTTVSQTEFSCSDLGIGTNNSYYLGQVPVTVTVTDCNGNSTTCTTTVNVHYNYELYLQCAGTLTVDLDQNCQATITSDMLSLVASAGVCFPRQTVTYSISPSLLTGVGTFNVVTTATDSKNNRARCTTVVTTRDVTVPVITCPSNITLNAGANCSAVATWTAPTATDNCGTATVVCSPASGSTFLVGTTTVTCTATDGHGNSSSCTFTVTVNDVSAPTITCPANITTTAGADCEAEVTYSVTATDNCSGVTVSSDHPSGSKFPLGTTTVNCTATDVGGNTSSCSFTVTVNDVTAPVITCPANMTFEAGPGCQSVVTWDEPEARDNCGVASVVCTPASGSTFVYGTTTVTCTATDNAGNAASCTFTVTVTDQTGPSITCPADIPVLSGLGCQTVVVWDTPIAEDNCIVASVVSVPPSGYLFPVGTTPVTVTATDNHGNSSSCTFNVTVTDNTVPLVICPADITEEAGPGCEAVVTWFIPFAEDFCGLASVVSEPESGSTFPVGTTPVTVTATDNNGNSSSCTFNVTVTDHTGPSIICPANITANADAPCQAIVTWPDPVATDNCGVASVTCSPASGSVFNFGTTTVTVTATDNKGNSSRCTFDVNVVDLSPPLLVCSGDITVNAEDECSAVVDYFWGLTDNCDIASVSTIPPSGSAFPVGTTTVIITATDVHGNSSSCSFTVTVKDVTPPVVTCPGNITEEAGSGCNAVVRYTASASDACGIASFATIPPSGSTFPFGTTTVTCTATDVHGNSSSCSFDVTVTDHTAPVVTCPGNITEEAGPDCNAIVTYLASASDVCGIASFITTPPSGSTFPLGTTTVTCTATDVHGNSSSCSFDVTVTGGASELSITCPEEIIVNAEEDCNAVAEWIPEVEGGCGNVTIVSVPASGSTFAKGSTLVTCTATDENGTEASCSFNVTVVDVTPPVITCPADITVNAGPRCKADPRWATPVVTDNCGVLSVTSDYASGSLFTAGTTKVTYTATDVNGNVSKCSFNVIVKDVTPPTFSNCPGNIVVNTGAGATTCGKAVTWTAPTAVDACGGAVTLTSNYNSGYVFPVGTTTVIYTAKDASNNTATCQFTVTVKDNTPPVITCPADITVNAGPRCKADPRWTEPLVTDNCGVLSVTSNHKSGELLTAGTTVVTYTATDVNGNVSTCSFNIIVRDVTPPYFTSCPANITVNTGADATTCGRVVTWPTPVAVDACGGTVTLTANHYSGDYFQVGTTTVTYTAKDASNNTATCTFTVTVNDKTPPVITCPGNMTVPAGPDCNAIVTYTATATDNCGVKSIVYSPASGSTFALGTTTVTATATDNSGNTASCSFTVTVTGTNTSLSITCPSEIVIDADDDCNAIVTYTPTATGSCGGEATVVTVPPSGSTFNIGTTLVQCTATDENGATANCSFNVTVNEVSVPYFTYCPPNIEVNTDPGAISCGKIVTWNTPVAVDDCGGTVTLTSNHSPGELFPVGTTLVTYTATDAYHHSATCSFTVKVNDKTSPVITCPANMTVNAGANCNAVVTYTATATDNCGIKTLVYNPASGSTFPIGTTTVTATATDNSGNSSSCTFTVTVQDKTPPVFTTFPANIEQNTTTCASVCGKIVSWTAPTATDNCGGTVSLASDYRSGTTFPVGTTTVTYTATDGAGNKATRSFTITVVDKAQPSITLSLSPSSLSPADHSLATITATVTAKDNCCSSNSIVLYSITSNEVDLSSEPGDLANDKQDISLNTEDYSFKLRAERLNSGTGRIYRVTYKVTDCNGNIGYKTASVTVPYNQPKTPYSSFEKLQYENFGIENVMPNPFNSMTTITFRVPENDNVSLVIYNSTGRKIIELAGSSLSPGIHTVTWDGIDESGRPVASGIYYATLKTGIYVTSVPIGLTK